MSNATGSDYLLEFYTSSSASWFAIYVWIVSTFVIVSDTFFIFLTLTSASLRKNPANFLLVGFCLADLLHAATHLIGGIAIWTGSVNNRGLCEIAGTLIAMTGACRFGFPTLIAANRFYTISKMPRQIASRCSVGGTLFAEKATIPLIVGWFCFSYSTNIPLIITHSFGEDQAGFCGAKKFTSILKLAGYEMSLIFIFVSSVSLTGVYYYRLSKFLQQNRSTSSQDSDIYTRSLMRVMKIETILPLLTESPTAVLTAGQMLLPELPMWLTRLLVAPYFFASCVNPWLAIALVRPFRRQFLELISAAKIEPHAEIELRGA